MGKVNIAKTLLKEYKDKELVAYVAERLNYIITLMNTPDDDSFCLGEVKTHLDNLSTIATAVSKRMNDSNGPKIVI